jgi:uncharacterized phiE125 gp8 family phage protein
LIKAARLMVEATAGRILVEQRWQLVLQRWPRDRVIALPLAPLIGIDRIRVFDAQNQSSDLPAEGFEADPANDPPRILVDPNAPEPGRLTRGILVDLRVGFGAAPADVPDPLRLAMKIMVAYWFENRGDMAAQSLPADALALVAPFRRVRL